MGTYWLLTPDSFPAATDVTIDVSSTFTELIMSLYSIPECSTCQPPVMDPLLITKNRLLHSIHRKQLTNYPAILYQLPCGNNQQMNRLMFCHHMINICIGFIVFVQSLWVAHTLYITTILLLYKLTMKAAFPVAKWKEYICTI